MMRRFWAYLFTLLSLVPGCDLVTGPAAVATVTISPAPDSVLIDSEVHLSVALLDSRGRELSGRRAEWDVSDPGVATLDSTGLLRGLKEGIVSVTATVEGRSDSVRIRIVPTRPRVTVIGPRGGALLDRRSVEVELEVQHPVAITGAFYSLDAGEPRRAKEWSCSPGACTIEVLGLHEGHNEITLFLDDISKVRGQARTTVTVQSRTLRYGVTVLATSGEHYVADLNAAGQVVGFLKATGGDRHAFLWSGGTLRELGPGTGTSTLAHGINDAGTIIGEVWAPGCFSRPAVWRDGTDPDEPALPCGSRFLDIDPVGTVLAEIGGELHLWRDGALTRIFRSEGTCAPVVVSAALNGRGDVVADLSGGSCKYRYVALIEDGGYRSLCPRSDCTLGGINQAGQVVMSRASVSPTFKAPELLLWQNGQLTRIGSFFEGTAARGIDDRGEIIAMDSGIPLLWRDGAFHVITLDDEAWTIDGLVGINATGRILATAKNQASGVVGALLLTPRS